MAENQWVFCGRKSCDSIGIQDGPPVGFVWNPTTSGCSGVRGILRGRFEGEICAIGSKLNSHDISI